MNGRAAVLTTNQALAAVAEAQVMVLTRAQLVALGVHPRHIAGHLLARRWREAVPGVVVLHCGPPSPLARLWISVLAAGSTAVLGAWTALALHGLVGWERPSVHLVVPRGRHVPLMPWSTVHESRRLVAAHVGEARGLPVHCVERSAVDAAVWSTSRRTASGLMTAVVQQGLSTPDRIRPVLDGAGRVRHRSSLFLTLADIDGGSQALSEIDLVRLCRRAGLPVPTQQRVRRDVHGRRRYLDAEWRLADGSVLALEIDGIGHIEASRWYQDLIRQAELDLDGPGRMIRLPASAVRLEPERVVAILARALGVPVPRVSTW